MQVSSFSFSKSVVRKELLLLQFQGYFIFEGSNIHLSDCALAISLPVTLAGKINEKELKENKGKEDKISLLKTMFPLYTKPPSYGK